MAAAEKLSRTEWRKQIQGMTDPQRIAELEGDADEFEATLNEVARSVKAQTIAMIAGMGTICLFLAGIVLKA